MASKFSQRNSNLSLRKRANASAFRSFGFNKTAVNEISQNPETVNSKHNLTADRIFNFDEAGIPTVLNTPKVLANKSQKQIGLIVSAERGELVTFGFIIPAFGNKIQPLLVLTLVEVHFMKGAPEDD